MRIRLGRWPRACHSSFFFSLGKEIRNPFLRKQEIDYLMSYFAFDDIYLCGGYRLKHIKLAEVDKL